MGALLSMKMGARETLWSCTNRYWELYSEIGEYNEKAATSTFRLGLLKDLELWEILTMRPPENMQQLMTRIKEYKKLEDDWSKIKARLLALSSMPRIMNKGFSIETKKGVKSSRSQHLAWGSQCGIQGASS